MDEKIQKVLARSGQGSRRTIEDWLRDGRITVNGRTAVLGDRIRQGDNVRVDGTVIELFWEDSASSRVLVYHKPVGEICTTSDPQGRPSIFNGLPKEAGLRWISVGRLDINTAGLLLITNDGELASRLMHPSYEIQREYAVRVFGEVNDAMLQQLSKGIELEDGTARFESIVAKGGEGMNRWYHVILREGRKREVRRLWEAVGAKVNRLLRIRYGPIRLDKTLKPGCWKELGVAEYNQLRELTGLPILPVLQKQKAVKKPGKPGKKRTARRTARKAGK